MAIVIPPALQPFVDKLVKSGRYPCETEVVHHALWLLKEQWDLDQIKTASLRKDIAVGIEQIERGDVVPFDVERIKRLGRKMLKPSERRDDGPRRP